MGRLFAGQRAYAIRLRALRAGFQLHLAKPVQPSELVTVVASLAARRT
jgi:CheY-like chemotaxis protein